MEQQADRSMPTQQQLDPEVFRRVWERVMPNQENSLVAVTPPARSKATPRFSAPPAPSTAPASPAFPALPTFGAASIPLSSPTKSTPVDPASAEEPPLCLGECSHGDTQDLRNLMDRAQEAAAAGQALAKRGGSTARALSTLAADHRRAFRQLSAAYFLITGERYRPAAPVPRLHHSLPLALREQFVREQRWEQACRRGAQAAGDSCLRELYEELAQDGALHAGTIRSILEQM